MSSHVAALNSTQARALVAGLAKGGVRQVVISPGSRSTPLVLAWAAYPAVVLHAVLDERVAGFLAVGMARASGRPVALVCTSGSAAAHYFPAIQEASCSRVPLIVLSADRPPELHDCGALQTLDQSRLYGNYVRTFIDLGTPATEVPRRWLTQVAVRSLDAACRVPAGPVHINVPFREPLWQPDVDASGANADDESAAILRTPPLLAPPLIDALATRLSRAERGVIVCGPLTDTGGASGQYSLAASVRSLAATLGWPVLAEATSQVRFARGAADGVVASYDALLRLPAFVEEARPDLVLRIGQTPTSKVAQAWLADAGRDRTVLVDEAGDWHDPSFAANTLAVAEPGALCRALRAAARPIRRDERWLSTWTQAEAAAQAALARVCAEGFWEGGIARTVAAALPDSSSLHVANSMPIRDLDRFAPVLDRDVRVYANRGASGIDGTLATAAGEALADPARVQVVLLGDLAFLHDQSALRIAVKLGASLVVVLIDNDGGGIFSFLPIAAHPDAFDPYFRTPQDADLAALAQASGASFGNADSYQALGQALESRIAQARRGPGVHVIAVRVDREHNVVQHRRAVDAVQQALVSPWLFRSQS